MPRLPILYSFRRCPYAMRARLALIISGIDCVVREVRLSNKPPELAAASPKATVPVLILPDGGVIDESIDIMVWAQDADYRHPESFSGSYLPSSKESKMLTQVQHDDLIAINDSNFKHHLDRYKYPEKFGCDVREHRDTGEAILQQYETLLAQSPFLSGAKPGLSDYALLPFIRQFAHVDRNYFYALPFPRLHSWLRDHLNSALFLQAMAHFPIWKEGDEVRFLIG
jgi:glutathione S-transferase